MYDLEDVKIAVIGLGYVGLPLALEFGKKYPTVGYDVDTMRVQALRNGKDRNLEVSKKVLKTQKLLSFTASTGDISASNVFIIAVPTPIDGSKQPNLQPLLMASETVGKVLKAGDTVIFESTVYPGATEEDCAPILETISGLKFNRDFFCGYSPERVNPGDTERELTDIIKITSGSTPEATDFVDVLYKSIIVAGTHKVSSIRVAEAAKIIENTQRDVNIALINELAIIFNKLGIDTEEVLNAAGTKWNFLPFKPGLVGGHCIGVDPYYLTHKSQSVGFIPDVIIAARKINDSMSSYVANRLVKKLIAGKIQVNGSRILILGLTFKENCADTRNSKVFPLIEELASFHAQVDVYDPWVSGEYCPEYYGFSAISHPSQGVYDAIVIAVAHDKFRELGVEAIRAMGKENHVLYDLKHIFPADLVDFRL